MVLEDMAGEWIPLQSSLVATREFFAVGCFNVLVYSGEDYRPLAAPYTRNGSCVNRRYRRYSSMGRLTHKRLRQSRQVSPPWALTGSKL